jgi:hypothetical protein
MRMCVCVCVCVCVCTETYTHIYTCMLQCHRAEEMLLKALEIEPKYFPADSNLKFVRRLIDKQRIYQLTQKHRMQYPTAQQPRPQVLPRFFSPRLFVLLTMNPPPRSAIHTAC